MRSFFQLSRLWLCAVVLLLATSEHGLTQGTSGDHQYTSEDIDLDSIFRNLGVHAQLELMPEDTALTEQVA